MSNVRIYSFEAAGTEFPERSLLAAPAPRQPGADARRFREGVRRAPETLKSRSIRFFWFVSGISLWLRLGRSREQKRR